MPLYVTPQGPGTFISDALLANPPQAYIDNMSAIYIAADGSRYVSNGSALVLISVNLNNSFRTFESFLPENYNPATDDCSTALVAAALWSSTNRKAVLFDAYYRISNCASITYDNINFAFNGPSFDVADNGTPGTLTNGAVGKIGILFKLCANLTITGAARFVGLGTLGVTSLMGLVYDSCPQMQISASMFFTNMAGGRTTIWCDNSKVGDILGKNIAGLATFEVPPTSAQGTLDDIAGCRVSNFGIAVCDGHILPLRYLSVLFNSVGAAIDNEDCTFGQVSGKGTGQTAQGVGIRSAVRCSMPAPSGQNWSESVNCFIGLGDTSWLIDQLIIVGVASEIESTTNDNAVVKIVSNEPTVPIGRILLSNVVGKGDGDYGLLANSGTIHIANLNIDGTNRSIVVFGGVGIVNLTIGSFICKNQLREACLFGQGVNLTICSTDIQSGPAIATSGAIRYDSTIGSGGLGAIQLDSVKYAQGAAANNYNYVVQDTANGFQAYRINNIVGAGGSGQARFGADVFSILGGQIYSTAFPTSGTYARPGTIWKSNAAALASPGWVLTTDGTPGTWSAMAPLI